MMRVTLIVTREVSTKREAQRLAAQINADLQRLPWQGSANITITSTPKANNKERKLDNNRIIKDPQEW